MPFLTNKQFRDGDNNLTEVSVIDVFKFSDDMKQNLVVTADFKLEVHFNQMHYPFWLNCYAIKNNYFRETKKNCSIQEMGGVFGVNYDDVDTDEEYEVIYNDKPKIERENKPI
jgi:hypothetical protein